MTEQTFGIVAEIQLSYLPSIKPSELPKITVNHDAYRLFIETWDTSQIHLVEQLKVMLLNKANRVLGICTLTTGNVSSTIADPKQIFAVAIVANASSIIVAHNHPSGSSTPSRQDHSLTEKLRVAGEILDITLVDHLIVTTEGFFSFAEDGGL